MTRILSIGAAVVLALAGCGEDDELGEANDGGDGGDIVAQVEDKLSSDGPPGEIASVECQDRSEDTYSCLVTYQRDGEIYEAFYDVIDNGSDLTVDFSSSEDPEAE